MQHIMKQFVNILQILTKRLVSKMKQISYSKLFLPHVNIYWNT